MSISGYKIPVGAYDVLVGKNGSIDIPLNTPLEARRDLLEVGAGMSLAYGKTGKALKTIQKKIEATQVALEMEREEMEREEREYEELEVEAIEIIDHIFNSDKLPK